MVVLQCTTVPVDPLAVENNTKPRFLGLSVPLFSFGARHLAHWRIAHWQLAQRRMAHRRKAHRRRRFAHPHLHIIIIIVIVLHGRP